jgi:hypothetical protein
MNIKFSVSSLRADTLNEPLAKGFAFSNHKTLDDCTRRRFAEIEECNK